MSPSFMMRIRIRRSSRLKFAENAASDIAKVCPVRCCSLSDLKAGSAARIDGVNTPTKSFQTSAVPGKQGRTPGPTDLLFPKWQRELFKTILDKENLRFDREGRPRTAYSLRHTYLCLRLMEGADIYQNAKNCRTCVEMIEKYYASHIKTLLDAAAINVMRPKEKKKFKGS